MTVCDPLPSLWPEDPSRLHWSLKALIRKNTSTPQQIYREWQQIWHLSYLINLFFIFPPFGKLWKLYHRLFLCLLEQMEIQKLYFLSPPLEVNPTIRLLLLRTLELKAPLINWNKIIVLQIFYCNRDISLLWHSKNNQNNKSKEK